MEKSIKQWKILVSTINIQLVDLVYFMENPMKKWKILVSTINIQLVDLVSFMANPMKTLENPSINYQHSARSGLFHGTFH